MSTPQSGLFALGTASHAYLEFDARRPEAPVELVGAVAALREPRTTIGGVNLVVGFRPELWRDLVPEETPRELEGFNRDIVGPDGYTMPATQHDAVLWISGSAYDVVFDMAREAIGALEAAASVAEESSSWPYRHDRDLTGFIDGSENPSLIDAPEFAVIPDGIPGAGGTILLLQKWSHDADAWEALPVARQEQVIGRTKDESVELDDKPAESHVARTAAGARSSSAVRSASEDPARRRRCVIPGGSLMTWRLKPGVRHLVLAFGFVKRKSQQKRDENVPKVGLEPRRLSAGAQSRRSSERFRPSTSTTALTSSAVL